ncbi:MAG: helix-turn-helix domain-containing protein [Candidatus Binatia bacterium]
MKSQEKQNIFTDALPQVQKGSGAGTNIVPDDLKDILLRGYETKDLDYKAPMMWDENNKKACCEVIKDILGMANTLGGYIVIGVSESPNGFIWDGISDEQARSYDTSRVNRFLQNYADPPINTTLRKKDHDGKTFVIIGVPRFSDTPHICQKDYPGVLTTPTLYVRTDNNETAPIRSSADFRSILEQATRNRGDKLLASVRAILTTGEVTPSSNDEEQFQAQLSESAIRFDMTLNPYKEKNYSGYREAAFYPARFEPNRFTLDELRAAAKRASVDFRGWPFLFLSRESNETYAIQDGLESLVAFPDFNNNDRVDFWRLQQSGFFYQRVLMWEESYQRRQGQPPTMDIAALAMYVAEAIHCLTKLYEGLLDDTDQVHLWLRVLGTKDRQLERLDSRGGSLSMTYRSKLPEIRFSRILPIADWRAAIVEHAVEISKEVFLRFNWEQPSLGVIRGIIQKMFERRL